MSRTFHWKIDCVRVVGLGVTELNGGRAIAVNGKLDEW